jgi:hypothetical protein
MFGLEKIRSMVISQIEDLMKNKTDFNVKKVLKTLKYKIKKEIIGPATVCIGSEGKVFSDIIIGKHEQTKHKIVIIYSSKKEEPYTLLLDTTKTSELETILNQFNSGDFNYSGVDYKNKSLQLSFLLDFVNKTLLSTK